MKNKYRKKEPLVAEQFDGSKEIVKEYGLRRFGFEGFIKTPNSMNNFDFDAPLIISEGDWILKKDNGKYGVLPDEAFRNTYERCN